MRGFFGLWCLDFPILCLACNGEEPLLWLLAFMSQHITDPEWASNESTAPGEVAKTMFCCGVTARVCILQSLEAGGNQRLASVQLTGDVNRLLMDQKWAAEPSTAPRQLTNKAHSSGISSRDCFVQTWNLEVKCIQHIKTVTMCLVTTHRIFEDRECCG